MTVRSYLGRSLLGTILCMCTLAATAQEARDPTVAPAEAVAMPGASGSAAPTQNSTVIVQGGKQYLVVGTRLVGVGQKVGSATLERITETEIWMRDGKQVTKVSRFSGIQRTVSKTVSVCAPALHKPARKTVRPSGRRNAAPKAATSQVAQSAGSCEEGQP